MGTFNYDLFINLSRLFGQRRGYARPSAPQLPEKRIFWYAVEGFHSQLPQSKFVDLNAFRKTAKSRFVSMAFTKQALKIEEPVSTVVATEEFKKTRPVLKLKPKAEVKIEAEAQPQTQASPITIAEEPKKERSILKLKTKVELPVIGTRITRRSSTEDLAAAFKAEMKLMGEHVVSEPKERRRHPLAHKSWAELLAEAEAPKKPKYDIDLASAFKSEMKALQAQMFAEQEKMGDITPPARPKTAFEPKTMSSQPRIIPPPRRTPRVRILAA